MIPQNQLEAENVRAMAQSILTEHLSIEIEGYKCDTAMVYDILLKAAVENASIETVCADLEGVADSNTIREQLNRALDAQDLRGHECEMNQALSANIPPEMPRRGLEMAMDYHDEPFYGKTPELRLYECRGKAKKGTTHFYRIASLYVIWRQVRITLALTYVLPEDTTLKVTQRLYEEMTKLKFKPRVLYLDKGFCSGVIIRYLQVKKVPTLMACPIRGKKGQGGTRALCRGRKSYRTPYTFSDGTCVDLILIATFTLDKNGQRRRTWLAFVIIRLDWSAQKAHQRYRRRFGIESSYRQLRQLRVITTSRHPILRFFLLALALLLVNIWELLRLLFARIPKPGPRCLDTQHFQLHRFIAFLRRAIEQLYGTVMEIPTYANITNL
jgi:putative transposase